MEYNRLLADILDCTEDKHDLETLLQIAETQFRLQGNRPPGMFAAVLRRMSCGSNEHVFGDQLIRTARVTIYRCKNCQSLQVFVNDKMRFGDLWHISLSDFPMIEKHMQDGG